MTNGKGDSYLKQVLTASMSRAMSTPMTDAAQPIPDRLKVRMSCLNLKWLTIFADREGVGLNAEQFTIRPSTCQNAHNPRHADWKFLCQHRWHSMAVLQYRLQVQVEYASLLLISLYILL